MLSWDPKEPEPLTFGRAKSMQRGGSMSRSAGGAGFSARLSADYAEPPPLLSSSASSRRSNDFSPLVKEGQHFEGWSAFVDAGHMNAEPADPSLVGKNMRPADEERSSGGGTKSLSSSAPTSGFAIPAPASARSSMESEAAFGNFASAPKRGADSKMAIAEEPEEAWDPFSHRD